MSKSNAKDMVKRTLRGAYVQAWVWVDAEDFGGGYHVSATPIRLAARAKWEVEGACEIDADAAISRSYEDSDGSRSLATDEERDEIEAKGGTL